LRHLSEFARSIGIRAARDYFRAVAETGAVRELTDDRVLSFARSVDQHTAEWYFWAIWGTKAVRELTDPRVLQAVQFFRSIDSPATIEYFLAIRETKAASELTDPKVLAFAEAIGRDAAVEYFGAFWETKAVRDLTNEKVLAFAKSMGGDAAREYFLAIRETRAVVELTNENILGFARTLGSSVAIDYFRAIRESRSPTELTDENVTLFAELIGKSAAREYFRVIGGTRKVAELTSSRLLRASGVIRAIGSDAALDYFLAVAASGVTPPLPESSARKGATTDEVSVPLLTLLDIPAYERYRPAALLGTSVLFWLGVGQFGGLSLGTSPGWVDLATILAAWGLLLGGVYLLVGVISERSSEEFLKRRRRLLNEHGIHWHDCLAGEQRCPLCWGANHTHEDLKFDYGRFCRCPAC
jgi:hypothetical protein